MLEDIFELIYNCSIQKKIIDQTLIDKLGDLVVSSKHLENYIKKITLKEEHKKSFILHGEYLSNKEINIFIAYASYLENSLKNGLFYDFEYYFYMNVKITWIILHEIEHGNHKKIYKENKSEILTKIIKPCIEISNGTLPLLIPFSKEEELVNWLDYHHDSFLDKRLADITALSTILKVLEID